MLICKAFEKRPFCCKFLFNYDESKNPVSKVNPNNTQDKVSHNQSSEVVGIQTIDNNRNVKWSSQYLYDTDGRLYP